MTTHFQPSEFACGCGRPTCDAPPMREAFLTKLEALRVRWGRPLVVTSGTRCRVHNADPDVHGAENSQHLYGNAADLRVASRAEAEELKVLAIEVGMGGIGTGSTIIHVDDGPPARRWVYT